MLPEGIFEMRMTGHLPRISLSRILSKLGGMIFLVIPLLDLLFLVEKEKQRNGVLTSVHSSLLLSPGGQAD